MLLGVLAASGVAAHASPPAFPGAEGFGVDQITGGRGGEVRKVTNLNDSGPGSFREAVAGDEPKIVVFEVGGIIRTAGVPIGANTTVAGQTSPSGITFYGWDRPTPKNDRLDPSVKNGGLSVGDNVILRHVRVRGSAYKGDCLAAYARNVILDHCSFSWSGDEIVSFWSGSRNVTIQWCTMEESVGFWHGEGGHNYGPMIGFKPGCGKPSGDYSIHHTLMAHHKKRGPELQLGPELAADVRNCVWYDMGGCAGLFALPKLPSGGTVSVVNNYAKPGPSGGGSILFVVMPETWRDELAAKGARVRAYYRGNVREGAVGQPEPSAWVRPEDAPAALPLWLEQDPGPKITTHSAEEARELVLERAGAWPRDATTLRTIREVRTGTGGWVMMPKECMAPTQWQGWAERQYPRPYTRFFKDDANEWPDLPAPADTDGDGMPNAWEEAKGLNPQKPDHNGKDLSEAGYTNLEVYINERAEQIIGKRIQDLPAGQ
jgi:hypothetical protein